MVTWLGDVLAVAVGVWLAVLGVVVSVMVAVSVSSRRRKRAALGSPLVEYLRARGVMRG